MSIISDAKDLAGLIKQIGDIELYQKILDLQSSIFELSNENIEQKEEIKRLNELQKIAKKMTFREQLYYMDGDSEPFCPRCWDSERKTIHLHRNSTGNYRCKNCDNNYLTDEYR